MGPWSGSRRLSDAALDKAAPRDGSRRGQYLGTLAATIGSFSLGTVLAWPAPALPQLALPGGLGPGLPGLTTEQQSWVAATINFGGFAAGPIAGLLMARHGKKVTMMVMCLPAAAGWLLLALAPSVPLLVLGRLLTGTAGAFSMLAPAFVGEVAEVSVRGGLSSIMQVMTMLGLLFTYTLGAFLPWRWLAWVCLAVPLLALPCLALLPRSPAFLLQNGRRAEARAALAFYRGTGPTAVEAELARLEAELGREGAGVTLGVPAILASARYRRPLGLAVLLMMMQQFSGIKVISSYIVQIFHNAGSEFNANICSIVVGVIQVTGTSLAVLVVDRCGRRKLLILSELFIAVAFCMLATFFLLQEQGSFSPAWLPLASLVLFAVAYSLGMGPLPWVLNSELFAREAKSASSSCGAAANWLCSFLVVKFAPSVEAAIGTGVTYLAFAGLAAAGTLLIAVAVPETRGLTEEEVAAMWGGGPATAGKRTSRGEEEELRLVAGPSVLL